ncbi:N-acetyltransferase [Naasia sp. SYSU D00948]|uniref:GNAT family N-acetyltransferase n=1 Tax=Naasia sp. SYSU D00948 TaxID=2817379 RepID=UPI001B30AC60|nr:GNAT family N-acetyltransferase [Naasia sp. SYSU D00948]
MTGDRREGTVVADDERADAYTITFSEEPSADDSRAVREGLDAYNVRHVGPTNWEPLALFVRDAAGRTIGGLTGGTYWGWLYVETLWLDESLQGQGVGTELLERAERAALERGCRHSMLDTMSFQALGFYEKQGYSVYGTIDDMPAGSGQERYFLRKRLQ